MERSWWWKAALYGFVTVLAILYLIPTVVPESKVAIQNVVPATNRLYVVDQAGGPSQIRIFALDGTPRGSVPLKPVSSVGEVLETKGDEILITARRISTLRYGCDLMASRRS